MTLAAIADELDLLSGRLRTIGKSASLTDFQPDVRWMIRTRNLRDRYIPGGWFADPAWDMLLDLYVAEWDGRRVSISSLCTASRVPPTTAMRWLARMIESGLFIREPDPNDNRRIFVRLHPDTREAMAGYLERTLAEFPAKLVR